MKGGHWLRRQLATRFACLGCGSVRAAVSRVCPVSIHPGCHAAALRCVTCDVWQSAEPPSADESVPASWEDAGDRLAKLTVVRESSGPLPPGTRAACTSVGTSALYDVDAAVCTVCGGDSAATRARGFAKWGASPPRVKRKKKASSQAWRRLRHAAAFLLAWQTKIEVAEGSGSAHGSGSGKKDGAYERTGWVRAAPSWSCVPGVDVS